MTNMPKLLKPGGLACHKHDDGDERFCSCKGSLKIESKYAKSYSREVISTFHYSEGEMHGPVVE